MVSEKLDAPTMETRALLTREQRHYLMLDPSLGAGNFLEAALRTNSQPDEALLWGDRDTTISKGWAAERLSLNDLRRARDAWASWYRTLGVQSGDPVAVYMADGIGYLIHYLALTYIGAIPALTNIAMRVATALGHFDRIGAVGIVTDLPGQAAIRAAQWEQRTRFVAAIEDVAVDLNATAPRPFDHDYDDPVMITHSSGTTGVPKPVLLQHGRWFHGIRHLLRYDAESGAERYLSALPASHNAAIAFGIYTLLQGGVYIVSSSQRGGHVVELIERFRSGAVAAFSQTFADMAILDLSRHDLSAVTLWVNSGDAAHEAHIRRLVEHGAHMRGGHRIAGSQFVDGLGSSELGHSSFRIIHTPYTDAYDRCIGIPQEWAEAAVLDDDGAVMGPHQVGLLGVKSPCVTTGYWNNSTLTHKSRRSGYFITGDLVYRDELGRFYHVDRVTDVVRTRQGPLYSLQTEELALKTCGQLADCVVVAFPDPDHDQFSRPILFAVPKPDQEITAAGIMRQVNLALKEFGRPTLAAVEVTADSRVPRGPTGKVLKRQLRETYAQTRTIDGGRPKQKSGQMALRNSRQSHSTASASEVQ